jgi:MFS family permease
MDRARAAVTSVFFLNGLVFVSWYSRLPSIQDDLSLSNTELGLALLGAPLGMLVAQPLTGRWPRRSARAGSCMRRRCSCLP